MDSEKFSLQSSHSVMSNSLQPHDCSTPGFPVHCCPGACSNSCPLSRWCHPNISFCHPFHLLPLVFPSIRVFSNEPVLHIKWPEYWSFSFNISPSNEYSGLISFRMNWLDLLAVQGTLKSLLQHHSSKASILWCSISLWSNSHTLLGILLSVFFQSDSRLSFKWTGWVEDSRTLGSPVF